MNTNARRWLVPSIMAVLFLVTLGLMDYTNYLAGTPNEYLLLNSLMLAIPLALEYVCAWLIIQAWQQHRQGSLGTRMKKTLFITPRVAGILLALFVSLFALDVFDMEGTIWMKIGAFLIHAAPAIFLLVLMVLAWRWEWVGALAFGLAALAFMVTVFMAGGIMGMGNFFLFVLPSTAIALLFWFNWRWKGELGARQEPR
jgi:hypothetical protein